MPERKLFEYSVLRVVPCIEREEFLNVGVILFSRMHRFLGARSHLDEPRVLALAPAADIAGIRRQLDLIDLIVRGGPGTGEIGALSQAERFHWLTSPRNTVVQPSPVHPGLCSDPGAVLEALFARLVVQTDVHAQAAGE